MKFNLNFEDQNNRRFNLLSNVSYRFKYAFKGKGIYYVTKYLQLLDSGLDETKKQPLTVAC